MRSKGMTLLDDATTPPMLLLWGYFAYFIVTIAYELAAATAGCRLIVPARAEEQEEPRLLNCAGLALQPAEAPPPSPVLCAWFKNSGS